MNYDCGKKVLRKVRACTCIIICKAFSLVSCEQCIKTKPQFALVVSLQLRILADYQSMLCTGARFSAT
jgi:hypothetical protein